MEFKTCSRCGETFPATTEFFPSSKTTPSGLYGQCRVCVAKRNKEYRERTREHIRQSDAEYRRTHREEREEYNRQYNLQHPPDPERQKMRKKEWYEENAQHARDYARAYRQAHPEECAEAQRRWEESHRQQHLATSKKYHQGHRDHYADLQRSWCQENREHLRNYWRKRREEDVGLRVNSTMSRAIRTALRGRKEGCPWEQIVGYTLEDLIRHLEALFQPGMTWDTYGYCGWHIDHRQPIASFRFTSTQDPEVKACWALSNLQPLWAHDNLSKGAKLDWAPADYESPRKGGDNNGT